MHSPEDDISLVANCEIYNHHELRKELESLGYRFRTRSDAEVILHGYRAWGAGVAARLSGMFAFGVWDGARRQLLLVRDRMGQKPLYYARAGSRFLFASEPKAILAALHESPRIEPEALCRYLVFDFVPTPWSIFKGIHKLPAATCLEVQPAGEPRISTYWSLPLPSRPGPPEKEVIQEIRERFDRAVTRRLMSDVPIGLLLSGGLDSTLVGAALARHGTRLETFSLGFEEPEFDESGIARDVARWLGTTHHEERFHARIIHDALPEVIEWLDEPFADPSVLAVHALSTFTSRSVKVALAGDGADELFGGYDVFLAAKFDDWTRWAGVLRPWALETLARIMPVREQHFSLDFRLRQFARGLCTDPQARPSAYTMDIAVEELRHLTGHPPGDILQEARNATAPLASGALDLAFRAYLRFFLESDILFKIDRAGMAHGLEIRSPFLDHELIEYVVALPGALKVPGLRRKGLLRLALGGEIPKSILNRRKQGFSLPVVRWINGELRQWFDDVLLDPSGYTDGLLRREAVEALLQRHRRGVANLRKPIWNLAILMLWKARWIRPITQRPDASLHTTASHDNVGR